MKYESKIIASLWVVGIAVWMAVISIVCYGCKQGIYDLKEYDARGNLKKHLHVATTDMLTDSQSGLIEVDPNGAVWI